MVEGLPRVSIHYINKEKVDWDKSAEDIFPAEDTIIGVAWHNMILAVEVDKEDMLHLQEEYNQIIDVIKEKEEPQK